MRLHPSPSVHPLGLVGVIGVQRFVQINFFQPSHFTKSRVSVSLLQPGLRGQSSPMCLHPPRFLSLIFQHDKLRASSHRSAQTCPWNQLLDVQDPRSSGSARCFSPLLQQRVSLSFTHFNTSSRSRAATA